VKGKDKKTPRATAAPPLVAPAPAPPRTWPRPPTPEERAANTADKAAALRSAAEVLRAAGLEDEAAGLDKPAATLEKESAPERPGGRLDACAGFVARAEKRMEGAKAAVMAAEIALKDAHAQQARLQEELAEGKRLMEELRADLLASTPAASPAAAATADLMGDLKALLQGLENGGWACTAAPPESVLVAMARLHSAVAAAAPMPVPELDKPLEQDPCHDRAAMNAAATAPMPEDTSDEEDAVMEELEGADSDEALVAIARRLQSVKRARRHR
jgi:hypothetical protein